MLDGRLADAEFAYDRDLAEGLPAMAGRLGAVVFHEKLGSLADKAHRLGGLVAGLAAGAAARGEAGAPPDAGGAPGASSGEAGGNGSASSGKGDALAAHLKRAAELAKADLVSQVVIEFPTLQGAMGEIYARAAGEAETVARAVGEQYLPLSATAAVPATLAGGLLAVAEKADNIAGAWVAGEKPSGSRDPYGLRRAAMGIVRVALAYSLRVPVRGLLESALDQYEAQGVAELPPGDRASLLDEMQGFVFERLQALLLDEGLPFPVVEAALGAPAGDVPALAARARAFAALAGRDILEDAAVAYDRCASLAGKARGAGGAPHAPDPALFSEEAERVLAAALAAAGARRRRRPLPPRDRERPRRRGAPAPRCRPLLRRRARDGPRREDPRQPAGAARRRDRPSGPDRRARPPADPGRGQVEGRGPAPRRLPLDVREETQEGSMAQKYVYHFREGNKDMKALLGGKGANLAEMTGIGLPVPPGFTVTTEVCNHYSAHGDYPEGLAAQVDAALALLEQDTGKKFGDPSDPLLLSVRSGARASMPGMMDTILNLGLNDTTVQGVVAQTQNPRFAYDCYRRFVSMYGDVVLGCKPEHDDEADPFEELLDEMKKRKGVEDDTDSTADDLKELVGRVQGRGARAHRAGASRTIRASSSGARSRPSSARG